MRKQEPWIAELNRRFPRRQPEPPYKDPFSIYDWVLFLFLILLILLIGTACFGQSVSPVLAQAHGTRTKGTVTFRNDQLVPVALTIEAESVSGTPEGHALYRHLDSTVSVRLAATSARLAPKQSFSVDYEITCQVLPCVVALQGSFSGLRNKEGLVVVLRMPEVVYICAREKGCRDSVRASWGIH